MYPINVVEKETTISKFLLRMWERRYTFPRPERDSKGERVYTNEDVKKLKLIKKLMEEGYRPSKIINQTLDALQELSKSFAGSKISTNLGMVVLVTSPELVDNVHEALKNHEVKKVIFINCMEDIKNMTL
ncbi:MAG: MerR family transcriptional regulator [Bacteriovorax sp.]|nr:MerR family transcriptional regulator [Bacteriovorax sp.]